jgi:hypothetical protein
VTLAAVVSPEIADNLSTSPIKAGFVVALKVSSPAALYSSIPYPDEAGTEERL